MTNEELEQAKAALVDNLVSISPYDWKDEFNDPHYWVLRAATDVLNAAGGQPIEFVTGYPSAGANNDGQIIAFTRDLIVRAEIKWDGSGAAEVEVLITRRSALESIQFRDDGGHRLQAQLGNVLASAKSISLTYDSEMGEIILPLPPRTDAFPSDNPPSQQHKRALSAFIPELARDVARG